MAVSHASGQAGELENDLVAAERRDAGVEPADGPVELLARHGMEEVAVAPRHLGREEAEVRAPARRLGPGERRGPAGRLLC
jgi:hypothetical protein